MLRLLHPYDIPKRMSPRLVKMSPAPKLGVLQLKTTFPRPPGDVGNPQSWGDIPVIIRVVEEADSDLVVGGGWGEELVDAFVREGEKMMRDEGCVAFVTSCGFVSREALDLFALAAPPPTSAETPRS